jgi:hypothetical protein
MFVRYVCMLLLALGLTGCASKQFKNAASLSGQVMVIGCLTYDSNAGKYVLTDRDGEQVYVLTEGIELKLQSQGNESVRVIGIQEPGTKTVKALRIEHVAEFCKTPF